MSQLKAFVGHSFTKEDEGVVRTFLEFFDQVKEMGIGFSWEHAKKAEPKVLAEKVVRLIQDKNLFIGICTKKERAIDPGNLKLGLFRRSMFNAKEEDFDWKTSDWIIQEIGLSIGRDMGIILLIEKGLRLPGGLQGNLEYITFNRKSPERSFNKILEMVRSLRPKATAVQAEASDVPATAEGKEESADEKSEDWQEPKDSWTRRHYEFVLMHMIAAGDAEGEKKIYETYLSSPGGQEEANANSWEAARESLRIMIGKGGRLSKLEKMAQDHPDNGEIHRYLGKAYQKYKEEEKAAAIFRVAAENERDSKLKLTSLGDAAIAYARSGDVKNKNIVVKEMKTIVKEMEDGEAVLLSFLQRLSDIEKDKDAYFAYAERLLYLLPDDNDMRFSLAHEYSEQKREDLALYHYITIPYHQRSSITWNNIGVANDRLDLHGKAVEAYRKAEESDETLAMSNLALKLIDAGFSQEAEAICDCATKIKDFHENVGHTIYRLKKRREEETEKEGKILKDVQPYHEFYRDFGRAAAQKEPNDHSGMWTEPHCRLQVDIKGGKFKAEGSYESPSLVNALARVKLGTAGLGQPPKINRYIIRYEGLVTGFAVKGNVIAEKVDGPAKSNTLFGDTPTPKEVLMIIADDLSEIRVYEKDAIESLRFYSIKRIEE